MRRTLLAVSIALTVVALVVGGAGFVLDALASLGNPTLGIAMEVAQIQPDCVPGTNCQALAYVVKALCGSLATLGAGIYRTEINVHNLADLAVSPILFQPAATGSFASIGGIVGPNLAKTIAGRAAIRVTCPDITNRLGTPDVMGFVRIQPPSGAELAVTAVWTRTH